MIYPYQKEALEWLQKFPYEAEYYFKDMCESEIYMSIGVEQTTRLLNADCQKLDHRDFSSLASAMGVAVAMDMLHNLAIKSRTRNPFKLLFLQLFVKLAGPKNFSFFNKSQRTNGDAASLAFSVYHYSIKEN
jgi:hypothetical protein